MASMTSNIKQHAGAGLVAAAIVGAALAQGLFEPGAYAAASIVIWTAVIAGLGSRALPSGPVGAQAVFAGLCLAGTTVLATASVGWASDQGRAFEEAVRVSFYLGLFTLAVCTASRAGRSEWLGGLTAGLGTVSGIALLAYLQPGLLHSGHSDIPNAAGRLSYPIGYWNGAAALLAGAVVLMAYASVKAPSRLLRALATAGIPLAGLGIWLASSRGGAISAVVGCIVLVAASADRARYLLTLAVVAAATGVLILAAHQMPDLTSGLIDSAQRSDGDRMSALLIALISVTAVVAWLLDGVRPTIRVSRRKGIAFATAAAVLATAAILAAHPAERFREFKAPPPTTAGGTVGGAGVSSNGRWQFWSAAVDAFESDPIGGVGAGGYEAWWARHTKVPLFVRNPHSLPLQEAAELGIAGIVLFVGFVGAVTVASRRRLASGLDGDTGVLLAVLIAGALGAATDWTWELPAAFGPAVVCAGLLTASSRSRWPAQNSYWFGIGTVAAAWVAMVAGGLVALSELNLRQSRDAAAQSRFADGISKAEDAHTVLPWSAEPYTQLALLDEARGDVDGALAQLRKAEQRDSEDWRLPLIEARLQQRRGDRHAARTAMERAQSLSPLLPIFNSR
jgi:O-Antigen ligase